MSSTSHRAEESNPVVAQPKAQRLSSWGAVVFAMGVLTAGTHFILANQMGLRASADMDVVQPLLIGGLPVLLALVLLKVPGLRLLAKGYFAGIAAVVIISIVRELIG